ncbi:MAG: ISAzo13-like element transposase-related protein [Planctomycetaceae bacterium]
MQLMQSIVSPAGDSPCGGIGGLRDRNCSLLAVAAGLIFEVCHFPPGISKWNELEHRLLCHITRNWQGVSLEMLEIVVCLIAATRTETDLEVHAYLARAKYPDQLKITDAQLADVLIQRDKFHGEWNYQILL